MIRHYCDLCSEAPSSEACVPECDHDWKVRDESFSHEFGTEIVVFEECELCGATRDYEEPCEPEPEY